MIDLKYLSGESPNGIALARSLTLGMVVVVTGSALVLGAPVLALTGASLVLSVLAVLAARVGGTLCAMTIGVALVGQAILFTSAFAGHPWQIDSHMLFFVVLAVAAIMRSVPALLAMAVVTALHHLGFGIVLPALVFPSVGLLENIERAAMHAVIVVLEVSFLTMAIVSQNREDADKRAAQQEAAIATDRAREAAEDALATSTQAEAANAAARHVTTRLEHCLHAVARQDLRMRLSGDVGPEFKQMTEDFNQALENVSRTLMNARAMVSEVQSEAEASADMTITMAQELDRQAREVTDAAMAMRVLSESLETTVNDIHAVRDQSQNAASKATEGGAIVRDAVVAMTQIKASSAEIEKIIQVIEDISFQTNLLALNAGVEAARAGQAGAGFAVVAAEVRALSHRTSEAANQVKSLISSSVAQVASGASMVDKAGAALDEIERSIADASGRVTDLSERASQQSGAVQDVSGSLAQIDTVIQSCAKRTEEISSTGAQMRDGAGTLQDFLAEFSLAPEDRHTPPKTPRSAA